MDKKRTYGSMPLNEKYFIYYCRVSVSEGLNIDLDTSKLMVGHYNKEVYWSCQHCHCVIEIKKGFKENPSVCNECFKLLQNQDRINPQIHIIWKENQKYRAFTNFHRSFLDNIFRMENIISKCGEISQETMEVYLNSST